MVREAWSGIDVFLKKRYDLIPKLVNTVSGYANHEQQLLEKVTKLRTQAMQASSANQKIASENELQHLLGQLMITVENYPDLKASIHFQQLQTQLAAIEGEIEMSRRYYNGTVRENNIAVESFPGNLIAQYFKFGISPFFELENIQQRESPKIPF